MMKNKHLSKAIASQKFFEFKVKLISKCKQNNIELNEKNGEMPEVLT